MSGVPNDDSKHAGLQLPNPYLQGLKEDHLYHLGLDTKTHDLQAMFGDVKFVCLGGTASRMERLARFVGKECGHPVEDDKELTNYAGSRDRYVLYKAGPVLCASHGIGVPSIFIILNELLKLLYYAKCRDVIFYRIGSCAGIGIKPGTVVITDSVINGQLRPVCEMNILGKVVERPAIVDTDLAKELHACAKDDDHFETVMGKTWSTDDFFEGQARVLGAVCEFTEEEANIFVEKLYKDGVRNIEMESRGMIALCARAGVRCGVLCVAFIDRLSTEDPPVDKSVTTEWESRPQLIVTRHIKKKLAESRI